MPEPRARLGLVRLVGFIRADLAAPGIEADGGQAFFMDPIAGGEGSLENVTVLLQFGEQFAGAIFSAHQLNSSNYLGNSATIYPTFVAGQGIEASDIVLLVYDPVFDLSTVQLTLRDTGPGDWIRVISISNVPLPPTAFVFLPGILLVARLRRS